jgi:hypothetical protein
VFHADGGSPSPATLVFALVGTAAPGRHPEREVIARDRASIAQDHGALDRVPELPDVARPGVATQRVSRFGVDAVRGAAQRPTKLLDERIDQDREIAGALAERRERDVEHREPVVEVLRNAPLAVAA